MGGTFEGGEVETCAVNTLEKRGGFLKRCLNVIPSPIKFLPSQPSSLFDFMRSQEVVFFLIHSQFGVIKFQNNVCIIRCFPRVQKLWGLCHGGCLGWRHTLAKYRLAPIALPECCLGSGLWPGLFCLEIPLSNSFCGLSEVRISSFPF